MQVFLLTLVYISWGFNTSNDGFFGYRDEMEQIVKQVADKFQDIYNQPQQCNAGGITFYDECKGGRAGKCYENFPQHSKCTDKGVYLSDDFIFHIISRSVNQSNLSHEEYEFICNSNKLQNTFDEVNRARNKNFATIYAASPSGVFVYHPGFKDKSLCKSAFDPRVRPWFSTGSTGMQNIIFFFLIKEDQNLKKAKELGQYFKNIIKAYDWIIPIDINNCPSTICSIHGLGTGYFKNQMMDMASLTTDENGWSAIKYDRLADNAKFFFENVPDSKRNIIMLITDDPADPTELAQRVDAIPSSIDARLFQVILGQHQQSQISPLRQLSCSNKGLLVESRSEEDYYPDLLRPFSTYFSEGVTFNKPAWSPIYDDALSFGQIITPSMPVYKYGNNTRVLVAVVGLDVTLSYLQNELNLAIDNLNLEFINSDVYDSQPSCGCDACLVSDVQNFTSSSPISWNPDEQSQDRFCCESLPPDQSTPLTPPQPPSTQGPNTLLIIIIVISVLLFLILSFLIGYCIIQIRRQSNDQSSGSNEQNPVSTFPKNSNGIIDHPLGNVPQKNSHDDQ